jgi:hypothetical protein
MTNDRLPADRVAIVVGAAGELGRATAVKLADRGMTVVAVDRNEPGLEGRPDSIAREVIDATDPNARRIAVKRSQSCRTAAWREVRGWPETNANPSIWCQPGARTCHCGPVQRQRSVASGSVPSAEPGSYFVFFVVALRRLGRVGTANPVTSAVRASRQIRSSSPLVIDPRSSTAASPSQSA